MSFRSRLLRCCGPGTESYRPLLLAGLLLPAGRLWAAPDLDKARQAFMSGRYDECATMAESALKERDDVEEWGVLLTEAHLTRGRYAEALEVATNSLAAEPRSLRLRWSAREALLANGQTGPALRMAGEIQRLLQGRSLRYRDPRDLIIFGRVLLLSGMDPKLVLDQLYDRVKKLNPKLREVYLASGDLALEKHDFALAARLFEEGLKQVPDDPDLHYGLAQAYAPSDQKQMLGSLAAALERNSNHVASLLLLADHAIDAEDYAGAGKLLDRVQAVNRWHPEVWAYRAVIAHLRNQLEAEVEARETALKFWPTNPRVDYLIGLKLSQKYRFAVGASHQNRALSMDSDYLPAKIQLAQDLLRLGEEADGWRLAEEVQRQDAYDVEANNLMTLKDVLGKFQTLTNAHFVLRMSPHEATLYGNRALELLEEARTRLGQKYGFRLADPTLVEVFNQEKDFAVRTFGMPDNDGFLGVCFGEVITANSPGSRPGRHFNWESMLWHEFCHVVTLQLTRNKMPRWLSEGISVYEEREANPAWGERLNPRYREMLLDKDLTPVSRLSAAFLAPKSALHLQFAYYESSLAVQFLVERFGREKLLRILRELGQGAEINDALAKHTAPMKELEKEFGIFARQTAEQMGPGLDWEKPSALFDSLRSNARPSPFWGPTPQPSITILSQPSNTTNFWLLTREADDFIEQKKWSDAKPVLEKLVQLYPDSTGAESAYRKLATTCRALGETNQERLVLAKFAEKDDEALDAYLRLMELGKEAGDWPAVAQNARRYLAVDPLVAPPYRYLAEASEATSQAKPAIEAYRALLQLDPANPAEVHYHLAKLLFEQGDPAARRQVLQALEEAPRYREALRLLLQMQARPTDAVPRATSVSPNPGPALTTSLGQATAPAEVRR